MTASPISLASNEYAYLNPDGGGTYYTLATASGYPIPFDAWQRVGASVRDSDGTEFQFANFKFASG